MTTQTLGTGPTHPTGPAGPGPGGPAGPAPGGPPPPKATYPDPPPQDPEPGPTTPRAYIPDPGTPPPPPPKPGSPPPPKAHLVDFGWKLEVRSRSCELLAVASVRDSGLWWMQTSRGETPVFVGGRETAESAMRELLVSA
jgi:hypothetical protein